MNISLQQYETKVIFGYPKMFPSSICHHIQWGENESSKWYSQALPNLHWLQACCGKGNSYTRPLVSGMYRVSGLQLHKLKLEPFCWNRQKNWIVEQAFCSIQKLKLEAWKNFLEHMFKFFRCTSRFSFSKVEK